MGQVHVWILAAGWVALFLAIVAVGVWAARIRKREKDLQQERQRLDEVRAEAEEILEKIHKKYLEMGALRKRGDGVPEHPQGSESAVA